MSFRQGFIQRDVAATGFSNWLERMTRTGIIIGIVAAAYTSPARTDVYNYSDAAYCAGGLKAEIESTDGIKASEANEEVLKLIRDLKTKIFVLETIVKHAIEQGKINAVTASKMTSAGYEDQNVCIKGLQKCFDKIDEPLERDKNIDADVSNKMFKECSFEPEKMCERIRKACE
jgi:hypothetical protein